MPIGRREPTRSINSQWEALVTVRRLRRSSVVQIERNVMDGLPDFSVTRRPRATSCSHLLVITTPPGPAPVSREVLNNYGSPSAEGDRRAFTDERDERDRWIRCETTAVVRQSAGLVPIAVRCGYSSIPVSPAPSHSDITRNYMSNDVHTLRPRVTLTTTTTTTVTTVSEVRASSTRGVWITGSLLA